MRNGYLIFLRNGALLAQPFDVGRLELGGTPASLVDHIQTTGTSASDVAGAFTVSETGAARVSDRFCGPFSAHVV